MTEVSVPNNVEKSRGLSTARRRQGLSAKGLNETKSNYYSYGAGATSRNPSCVYGSQLAAHIFNYVRGFGKALQNYALLRRTQDCDPPKDYRTSAAPQKTLGAASD